MSLPRAVGEIYTPATNWIQNALKYAPGSNDQVNVLADLQQGAAEVMFDVGLRLNVLNSAGKKQNWDLVTHEAEEIEESFDRLMITRPDLSTDLENFITSRIDPLVAVASAPAPDKTALGSARGALHGLSPAVRRKCVRREAREVGATAPIEARGFSRPRFAARFSSGRCETRRPPP